MTMFQTIIIFCICLFGAEVIAQMKQPLKRCDALCSGLRTTCCVVDKKTCMVSVSRKDKSGGVQWRNQTGKIVEDACLIRQQPVGIVPLQAGQLLCQRSCKGMQSGCCVVSKKICKVRQLSMTSWTFGKRKRSRCYFSHTKPLRIGEYTYPKNPKIPRLQHKPTSHWQIKRRPVVTQYAPARWVYCKPNCRGKWSSERLNQMRSIDLDGKKGNEFIVSEQPYKWTSVNQRGIPVDEIVILRRIKGQYQEILSASYVAIIELGKQKKNPDLFIYHQTSSVDIEKLHCSHYKWNKGQYQRKSSCVARQVHKRELKRVFQSSQMIWHHKSFAFPWSSYKANTTK